MIANLSQVREAYSFRISPHYFKDFCYFSHLSIVVLLILYIKSYNAHLAQRPNCAAPIGVRTDE